MTGSAKGISRRAALVRLGLGAAAVYCAPAMTSLSAARAASGSGKSGSPSEPSAPSAPSTPSTPSAPTAPSNPTAPSDGVPSPPPTTEPNTGSRAASGGCSGPSGAERASISRRDMARANAAVARGEAKPLREIVGIVRQQFPGRLIRVGFNSRDGAPRYWLQIVSNAGSVQTVTVEAGSGQVSGVKGC